MKIIVVFISICVSEFVSASNEDVELFPSSLVPFPFLKKLCPANYYYNKLRKKCMLLPGGGNAVTINCLVNCASNEIRAHPDYEQFYTVCSKGCFLIAKCPKGMIFDKNRKRCTRCCINVEICENSSGEQDGNISEDLQAASNDYANSDRAGEESLPDISVECPKNQKFSKILKKCAHLYRGEHRNDVSYFPKCGTAGSFRSPKHCSLYYVCKRKKYQRGFHQEKLHCPSSKKWYDPKKGKCLPKEQVVCNHSGRRLQKKPSVQTSQTNTNITIHPGQKNVTVTLTTRVNPENGTKEHRIQKLCDPTTQPQFRENLQFIVTTNNSVSTGKTQSTTNLKCDQKIDITSTDLPTNNSLSIRVVSTSILFNLLTRKTVVTTCKIDIYMPRDHKNTSSQNIQVSGVCETDLKRTSDKAIVDTFVPLSDTGDHVEIITNSVVSAEHSSLTVDVAAIDVFVGDERLPSSRQDLEYPKSQAIEVMLLYDMSQKEETDVVIKPKTQMDGPTLESNISLDSRKNVKLTLATSKKDANTTKVQVSLVATNLSKTTNLSCVIRRISKKKVGGRKYKFQEHTTEKVNNTRRQIVHQIVIPITTALIDLSDYSVDLLPRLSQDTHMTTKALEAEKLELYILSLHNIAQKLPQKLCLKVTTIFHAPLSRQDLVFLPKVRDNENSLIDAHFSVMAHDAIVISVNLLLNLTKSGSNKDVTTNLAVANITQGLNVSCVLTKTACDIEKITQKTHNEENHARMTTISHEILIPMTPAHFELSKIVNIDVHPKFNKLVHVETRSTAGKLKIAIDSMPWQQKEPSRTPALSLTRQSSKRIGSTARKSVRKTSTTKLVQDTTSKQPTSVESTTKEMSSTSTSNKSSQKSSTKKSQSFMSTKSKAAKTKLTKSTDSATGQQSGTTKVAKSSTKFRTSKIKSSHMSTKSTKSYPKSTSVAQKTTIEHSSNTKLVKSSTAQSTSTTPKTDATISEKSSTTKFMKSSTKGQTTKMVSSSIKTKSTTAQPKSTSTTHKIDSTPDLKTSIAKIAKSTTLLRTTKMVSSTKNGQKSSTTKLKKSTTLLRTTKTVSGAGTTKYTTPKPKSTSTRVKFDSTSGEQSSETKLMKSSTETQTKKIVSSSIKTKSKTSKSKSTATTLKTTNLMKSSTKAQSKKNVSSSFLTKSTTTQPKSTFTTHKIDSTPIQKTSTAKLAKSTTKIVSSPVTGQKTSTTKLTKSTTLLQPTKTVPSSRTTKFTTTKPKSTSTRVKIDSTSGQQSSSKKLTKSSTIAKSTKKSKSSVTAKSSTAQPKSTDSTTRLKSSTTKLAKSTTLWRTTKSVSSSIKTKSTTPNTSSTTRFAKSSTPAKSQQKSTSTKRDSTIGRQSSTTRPVKASTKVQSTKISSTSISTKPTIVQPKSTTHKKEATTSEQSSTTMLAKSTSLFQTTRMVSSSSTTKPTVSTPKSTTTTQKTYSATDKESSTIKLEKSSTIAQTSKKLSSAIPAKSTTALPKSTLIPRKTVSTPGRQSSTKNVTKSIKSTTKMLISSMSATHKKESTSKSSTIDQSKSQSTTTKFKTKTTGKTTTTGHKTTNFSTLKTPSTTAKREWDSEESAEVLDDDIMLTTKNPAKTNAAQPQRSSKVSLSSTSTKIPTKSTTKQQHSKVSFSTTKSTSSKFSTNKTSSKSSPSKNSLTSAKRVWDSEESEEVLDDDTMLTMTSTTQLPISSMTSSYNFLETVISYTIPRVRKSKRKIKPRTDLVDFETNKQLISDIVFDTRKNVTNSLSLSMGIAKYRNSASITTNMTTLNLPSRVNVTCLIRKIVRDTPIRKGAKFEDETTTEIGNSNTTIIYRIRVPIDEDKIRFGNNEIDVLPTREKPKHKVRQTFEPESLKIDVFSLKGLKNSSGKIKTKQIDSTTVSSTKSNTPTTESNNSSINRQTSKPTPSPTKTSKFSTNNLTVSSTIRNFKDSTRNISTKHLKIESSKVTKFSLKTVSRTTTKSPQSISKLSNSSPKSESRKSETSEKSSTAKDHGGPTVNNKSTRIVKSSIKPTSTAQVTKLGSATTASSSNPNHQMATAKDHTSKTHSEENSSHSTSMKKMMTSGKMTKNFMASSETNKESKGTISNSTFTASSRKSSSFSMDKATGNVANSRTKNYKTSSRSENFNSADLKTEKYPQISVTKTSQHSEESNEVLDDDYSPTTPSTTTITGFRSSFRKATTINKTQLNSEETQELKSEETGEIQSDEDHRKPGNVTVPLGRQHKLEAQHGPRKIIVNSKCANHTVNSNDTKVDKFLVSVHRNCKACISILPLNGTDVDKAGCN